MLILLLPMVVADWETDNNCEQDSDCIISRKFINDTTGDPISDANCTVEIFSPSSIPLVNATIGNQQAINFSSGYYNYTINYHTLGTYPSTMFCNTSKGDFDEADITFTIVSPTHYNNYLYTLLVLIPFSIFIIGWKKDIPSFIMLSGILLTLFGVAIYAKKFPYLNWEASLITQAFAIVIFAIGVYIMLRISIEYASEARIE